MLLLLLFLSAGVFADLEVFGDEYRKSEGVLLKDDGDMMRINNYHHHNDDKGKKD
jgi:hypothetical protein